MTLYQAYVILKHHSEWRDGRQQEMVKPEKLSKALEVILQHLEIKLTKESYAAV